VHFIDQTCERIGARNFGTAGGNEQTMQRRDASFAIPLEITHQPKNRVP
jgi:hypothetical protein